MREVCLDRVVIQMIREVLLERHYLSDVLDEHLVLVLFWECNVKTYNLKITDS